MEASIREFAYQGKRKIRKKSKFGKVIGHWKWRTKIRTRIRTTKDDTKAELLFFLK